jgi:hypothetical protein
MNRVANINNRIECHPILSGEVSTDRLTLHFDESMNMNMSKFKRLDFRKIKCILSDSRSYPFAIYIMYYDRSTGVSYMYLLNIRVNLTTQKPIEIAVEIVNQLNAMLESKNKTLE